MQTEQIGAAGRTINRRTVWLSLATMSLLIFDLFFLALSDREQAPYFYVNLSMIAYQRDLTSSRPLRYPVWQKDGWFIDGTKRISGNELLELEPSPSPDRQCNITYRLADNATLRDFKASIEAAWFTANSALVIAPKAYSDIDPAILGIVYYAPDMTRNCPARPAG